MLSMRIIIARCIALIERSVWKTTTEVINTKVQFVCVCCVLVYRARPFLALILYTEDVQYKRKEGSSCVYVKQYCTSTCNYTSHELVPYHFYNVCAAPVNNY